MNAFLFHSPALAGLFVLTLLAGHTAGAAISGINQAFTNTQLVLNDTGSFNSLLQPGTTVWTANQTPWAGNPLGVALPNMPVTGDSASFAWRAFSWNFNMPGFPYGLDLQIFSISQNPTGSGSVTARLQFAVQYQTDAAGLTSPSLFLPQYLVSGTVQTGGYAFAQGQISYISAANGLLQQANYNYGNTTAGAFVNQPLVGVLTNAPAPLNLPGGDTLTVSGYFTLQVDPASITITTASAVPELPAVALWTLGLVGLCARAGVIARRARRCAT
jgi:hypothetical protein